MAARRYRISRVSSTQEEKLRIPVRPCNVLFIIETPMKFLTISLLNIFFAAKGANCYVAMATVIF